MYWWELIWLNGWTIIISAIIFIIIIIIGTRAIGKKLRKNSYWNSLNLSQKKWLVTSYVTSLSVASLVLVNLMMMYIIIHIRLVIWSANYNIIYPIIITIFTLCICVLMWYNTNKIHKIVDIPSDVWEDALKQINVNMNMKPTEDF